jgi:hypothetical protein
VTQNIVREIRELKRRLAEAATKEGNEDEVRGILREIAALAAMLSAMPEVTP